MKWFLFVIIITGTGNQVYYRQEHRMINEQNCFKALETLKAELNGDKLAYIAYCADEKQ